MRRSQPIRVLLAASEVVGFAKTGGLADVVGSLPPALARRGCECAVILPFYRCVRTGRYRLYPTEHIFQVPISGRAVEGRLWRSALPGTRIPAYLVESADYFDRDDPNTGAGLYQFQSGAGPRDYPDNCERFVFFCRAVLEAVRLLDLRPDVLHLNDWQTGLVAVYLREEYQRGDAAGIYSRVRTLFTIHNIAYQGLFPPERMEIIGLDRRLFNPAQLEFCGYVNFLKAGLVFSDFVNTVSPTYAREILTPYFGCGLQGVLRERSDRLFGIVNGCDYAVWNPANDPHLPARYDVEHVAPGKPKCKEALQRRTGLAIDPKTPLLGVVARLVEQKGIELIIRAAANVLRQGAQLAVLGQGDPIYHQQLQDLQARFPGQLGVTFGFDEALAHQIEAGADLFLMPSLYEPFGLNQLYSMRYGTPPVVRRTGGLADTVVDATPAALTTGTATGFAFVANTPDAFLEALQRGMNLYREQSAVWRGLLRAGMKADWSWDRSAAEYVRLYERLVPRTA